VSESLIVEQVRQLCIETRDALQDRSLAVEVSGFMERLDGPLRVAVAGRVKAGKSTLLNALVGERLAPTDAGECTRIVSWYVYGPAYRVDAVRRDGSRVELSFSRDDGALVMDLGSLDPVDVERLEIQWPAAPLRTMTLIDTPGLASLDDSTSARTRDFLAVDADRPAQADVVIYLMRHLHRRDAEFLDALADRSLAESSAANAVAVLSRADEIGAGRLDAFESASRIATRYALDDHIRRLCVGVLPASALMAETAATLEEHEVASLRALAATPDDELAALLLSADRFRAPGSSTLDVDVRAALLGRLGLFGVRFALDLLRRGEATTATEVADSLATHSGVPAIAETLRQRFLPRAQALQARSALIGLRSIARRVADTDTDSGRSLENELERIEASALEFTELRLLHLVLGGATQLSECEVNDVALLAGASGPAARVAAPSDELRVVANSALASVERWRTRASAPLVDSPTREACELAARVCESIVASTRVSIDQLTH
jgi:hypothetical protein